MATPLHDEDDWEVVGDYTDPCDVVFLQEIPTGATRDQRHRLACIQASLRTHTARISRVHFAIMMEETIRGTPSVIRAALVDEARALGRPLPKLPSAPYPALLVERKVLTTRMQLLLKERTELRMRIAHNEAD